MTYEVGVVSGSGSEFTLQPTSALRHVVSLCAVMLWTNSAMLAPNAGVGRSDKRVQGWYWICCSEEDMYGQRRRVFPI